MQIIFLNMLVIFFCTFFCYLSAAQNAQPAGGRRAGSAFYAADK